jgi:hypothetical protein
VDVADRRVVDIGFLRRCAWQRASAYGRAGPHLVTDL